MKYRFSFFALQRLNPSIFGENIYDTVEISVEINHNPNWPYIPDHPYSILIIGDSVSGKANVLLKLMKHQRPDIDINYLLMEEKN